MDATINKVRNVPVVRHPLEIRGLYKNLRKVNDNTYCKALFIRGGLIFAYFAENENSAKIKHAKIKIDNTHCISVSAVCMHTYCTTSTKIAYFAIPVC